jgi:hypothetical protein
MRFSERNGYVKPVEALKREMLDEEGVAAVCTCFDYLYKWLNHYDVDRHAGYNDSYTDLEENIWCFFMNKRKDDFWTFDGGHMVAATSYLESKEHEWFHKFDLIEYAIQYLKNQVKIDVYLQKIIDAFLRLLNNTFKRLNYAYRVVDEQIVEITNAEEIKEIEEALDQNQAIRNHLSAALKHLSDRPNPDYRNSIKESISAVEVLCREITGETTLGDALRVWEKKGVKIPTFLKSGIEKLYIYTNDQKTGIRHALMDDKEVPRFEEAKFMLVACSAFVNYIQSKRS